MRRNFFRGPWWFRVWVALVVFFALAIVASVIIPTLALATRTALLDHGLAYALLVAKTAEERVAEYMRGPEKQMEAWHTMVQMKGYRNPWDRPNYHVDESWGFDDLTCIRTMMQSVGYREYSSMSRAYLDGSIVVSLIHPRLDGWITDAVQTIRPTNRNGTLFQRTYHESNMSEWQDVMPLSMLPERAVYEGPQNRVTMEAHLNRSNGRRTCFSLSPLPDNNDYGNPRYLLYITCTLFNQSNVNVGLLTIGRYLSDIDSFLRSTPRTGNTQLLVADSTGQLVAGTLSGPSPVAFYTNETKPFVNDTSVVCTSTRRVSGGPELFGCRMVVASYSYPPLQAALAKQPDFANVVRDVSLELFKVDGRSDYLAVSVRIPSIVQDYSMNLLVFLPVDDVMGDVWRMYGVAIGIAGLLAVAAITIAIVALDMLVRAQLDELECDGEAGENAELLASDTTEDSDEPGATEMPVRALVDENEREADQKAELFDHDARAL